MNTNKHNISEILRILATKGTYETLLFIKENKNVGYNSILKHILSNKIVKSRASMNATVTKLTDMGILERTITQDRPIRVSYKISERGYNVMKHLDGIKQTI